MSSERCIVARDGVEMARFDDRASALAWLHRNWLLFAVPLREEGHEREPFCLDGQRGVTITPVVAGDDAAQEGMF